MSVNSDDFDVVERSTEIYSRVQCTSTNSVETIPKIKVALFHLCPVPKHLKIKFPQLIPHIATNRTQTYSEFYFILRDQEFLKF